MQHRRGGDFGLKGHTCLSDCQIAMRLTPGRVIWNGNGSVFNRRGLLYCPFPSFWSYFLLSGYNPLPGCPFCFGALQSSYSHLLRVGFMCSIIGSSHSSYFCLGLGHWPPHRLLFCFPTLRLFVSRRPVILSIISTLLGPSFLFAPWGAYR